MAPLTPDTLSVDWAGWRKQWEFTHTARAIFQFAGLAALIYSVLAGWAECGLEVSDEILRAAQLASKVPRVKSVRNDIRLK